MQANTPYAAALTDVDSERLRKCPISVLHHPGGLWLRSARACLGVAPGSRRALLSALLSASVFGRMQHPSVLDHFVRGRLYQLVCENPGIHFAELRRQLGLANGTATHHLGVLEQEGF